MNANILKVGNYNINLKKVQKIKTSGLITIYAICKTKKQIENTRYNIDLNETYPTFAQIEIKNNQVVDCLCKNHKFGGIYCKSIKSIEEISLEEMHKELQSVVNITYFRKPISDIILELNCR